MICCEHSARDPLTTSISPHTMIIVIPQAVIPRLPQTPNLPTSSIFSDTVCPEQMYDPIGRKYFLHQNSASSQTSPNFDNTGDITTPASSAHVSDALWLQNVGSSEEYEYYLIPEFDDTTWQASETRDSWVAERRNSWSVNWESVNRSRTQNLQLPLSPMEAADYGDHTALLTQRPQLALPRTAPRSERSDTRVIRQIIAWIRLHMRRHRPYVAPETLPNYTWSVGSSRNTRGQGVGTRGSRGNRSRQHTSRPRSRPRSRFGLWR